MTMKARTVRNRPGHPRLAVVKVRALITGTGHLGAFLNCYSHLMLQCTQDSAPEQRELQELLLTFFRWGKASMDIIRIIES